jgi:hypothetical protein
MTDGLPSSVRITALSETEHENARSSQKSGFVEFQRYEATWFANPTVFPQPH